MGGGGRWINLLFSHPQNACQSLGLDGMADMRWGRREAGEVCSDPRLWPLLGLQNGQGAGTASSPWLAKETPAFHSPHQRMTTALLYGFCFEHSDVGTCGHSCLRRPLSQNQTELPGCSFYHLLCFQALKYQSNLKKATEAEIRSSVSTGERVRPLDL